MMKKEEVHVFCLRFMTFATLLALLSTTLAQTPFTPPFITVQSGGAEEAPSQTPTQTLPQPSPDLSPEEVVRAQLEALQRNDDPFEDAGIETTFNFASPNNKRVTGPLKRFTLLFDTPAYRPMLNHASAEYGPFEILGNAARGRVVLTTPQGERVGYEFTLSKQTGPLEGVWMTDGVRRYEVPQPQRV